MAYDFNSLTEQADEATNRDKFYTDFEDVDPNVLHQISELTAWMRSKGKGSDVREVIAQLFERTWLEGTKEGNANLEVAQARGIFETLGKRLESKESDTATQLNVIKSRLDNFGSLEEGSVTGDAELIDGRISFDGVTHKSIGDSIRNVTGAVATRLSSLSSDLGHFVNLEIGYTPGAYQSDGTFGSTKYSRCKIVSVVPGELYEITTVGTRYIHNYVFLDSANNVILSSGTDSSQIEKTIEVIVPQGASKLCAQAPKDRNVTVKKYELVRDFNLVDPKANLFKYTAKFLSANKVSETTFDITGVNGGLRTNAFSATSNKVVINTSMRFTTTSVDVKLAFVTNTGAQRFKDLGHFTGGKMDANIAFDPANLIVYEYAVEDSFYLIVQSNESSSGQFIVDSFTINQLDSLQQSPVYDQNLRKMLEKITASLPLDETVTSNPVLTSPNGTKYKLSVTDEGILRATSMLFKKGLYLGNSLLLGFDTNEEHGPAFGMAASNYKKDYAYLLTEKLKEKYSSYTANKLHCAQLEQSENDETSLAYIEKFKSKMTNDTDFLLIQIGDNVNNEVRKSNLIKYLHKLIDSAYSINSNVQICLVGCWFNTGNVANDIRTIAESKGCTFVDITNLNITDNQAKTGTTISFEDGSNMIMQSKWATHPGDEGFELIANRIFDSIG